MWQTCSQALALFVCGVRFPGCCCWDIAVYHSAHSNTIGGTEPAKVSKNEKESEFRAKNKVQTEFSFYPSFYQATHDSLHFYAKQYQIEQ